MKKLWIAFCFILCALVYVIAYGDSIGSGGGAIGSGQYWYIDGSGNVATVGDRSVAMGTPTSVITANTILAESQTMGHVYVIDAATSPIIKLPTLTDDIGSVLFIDGTTAGNSAGVTVFGTQTIYYGQGNQAYSGTTVWWSGTTGYVTAFKAVTKGGALAWQMLPADVTISKLP